MALFVDNMRLPYRRMLMSHLVADSYNELLEAQKRLGIPNGSIQYQGTYKEHLDVSQAKREQAIKELRAEPVSILDMGRFIRARRKRMESIAGGRTRRRRSAQSTPKEQKKWKTGSARQVVNHKGSTYRVKTPALLYRDVKGLAIVPKVYAPDTEPSGGIFLIIHRKSGRHIGEISSSIKLAKKKIKAIKKTKIDFTKSAAELTVDLYGFEEDHPQIMSLLRRKIDYGWK